MVSHGHLDLAVRSESLSVLMVPESTQVLERAGTKVSTEPLVGVKADASSEPLKAGTPD